MYIGVNFIPYVSLWSQLKDSEGKRVNYTEGINDFDRPWRGN